jgi:serine/threonine protein kinase
MRYRLVRELTAESILVSADAGIEVVLDKLDLPVNIKESYRLELHNEIRKISAAEERVTHPGLLKYNGFEKYEDGYYLTRAGTEREGTVPYQPGDLEDVIRDLLEIARMMDAYHRQGMVLGGISPGQLKTGPGGELWFQDPPVINLLAKLLGEGFFFNMPAEVMKSAAWDGRSDAFSWGELAYRLLTGEDPFYAEKSEDRAAKIINGMMVEPRNIEHRLSEPFSRMIAGCLDPDPQKRPKTVTIIHDLEALIQNRQCLAAPETARLFKEKAASNRKRQQSKEKLWMWWRKFGFTVLITVAVVIVFFAMGMNRGRATITSKTKPVEVLNYYFKAIRKVDVSLMDETLHKAKNSLSDTLGNVHVINVSQKANQFDMKDDMIKVTVEGLTLDKQVETDASVVYNAKYTVKFATPVQLQYIERQDVFTLRPVRKVWRITEIKVLKKKNRTIKLNREKSIEAPGAQEPPIPNSSSTQVQMNS